MDSVPKNIKIYHITHVKNLSGILEAGALWSDAKRIEMGLDCEIAGMPEIKRRRLERLEVSCYPGTKVGDYVPFNFCPRSVMLYVLHRDNLPDLVYHGGQRPMIHLVADLRNVVAWADSSECRWAFSDSNAGASYAGFYSELGKLDLINWTSVAATNFRDSLVKEAKQAEFLVHESFPWKLVERIGVIDASIMTEVEIALKDAGHKPLVSVERDWYY